MDHLDTVSQMFFAAGFLGILAFVLALAGLAAEHLGRRA